MWLSYKVRFSDLRSSLPHPSSTTEILLFLDSTTFENIRHAYLASLQAHTTNLLLPSSTRPSRNRERKEREEVISEKKAKWVPKVCCCAPQDPFSSIADSSMPPSRIRHCPTPTLFPPFPQALIHSDHPPLLSSNSQLTHTLPQPQTLSINISKPTRTGRIRFPTNTRISWKKIQRASPRPSYGSAVPIVGCPRPPSSVGSRVISSYIATLPMSCILAT